MGRKTRKGNEKRTAVHKGWEKSDGKHASPVRRPLEYLGMKRPTYDTVMSQDGRTMNLKETVPDNVEKMMVMWSKEKF